MGNGQFNASDVAQVEQDIKELNVVSREIIITARRRPESGPGSFGAGFVSSWITGDDGEEVSFELLTGAGLGNPFLSLCVTIDGESFYEDVDMRKVLHVWVDEILASR